MINTKLIIALSIVIVGSQTLNAQSWQPSSPNIYFTGGNVGIGNTSPVTKLHLNGTFFADNTSTNQICLQNNGSYYGSIFTPGPAKWSFGYTGDRETLGTSVLTWTDGGNVGIGTTSPVTKLHLQGTFFADNTNTNQICLQNNGNYYGSIFTPGAAKWSIGYTGDRETLGTSVLTWTDGGNVGIGTTSPVQKLTIDAGSSNGGIQLQSTSGQNVIRYFQTDAGTNVKVMQQGIYGGKGFLSGVNDAFSEETYRFFTFDLSNGNVGIGTNNPGAYRLAVEGIIGARKVKVTQAPWADYVFDDQYKLPSLSEVEAFINKHKHLPEVPTTKEVEANGLDLGDSQALLLKKIEELTLYIIQQQKEIEGLKTEIKSIKRAGK